MDENQNWACLSKGFFDKKIKGEFGLLLIFSTFVQATGSCTVTNKYLASMLNVSECTISRKINKLKSLGYIDIKYNKRGCEVLRREISLRKMSIVEYQDCQSCDIPDEPVKQEKHKKKQIVSKSDEPSLDCSRLAKTSIDDYQKRQSRNVNEIQESFNFIDEKQEVNYNFDSAKEVSTIDANCKSDFAKEKESSKEKEYNNNIYILPSLNRDDKKIKGESRKEKEDRKRLVPLDWKPDEQTIAKLKAKGLDVDYVVEKFINSCHAKNYKYLDFNRAILSWNWGKYESPNQDRYSGWTSPAKADDGIIAPPDAKRLKEETLARRAEATMKANMDKVVARFANSMRW